MRRFVLAYLLLSGWMAFLTLGAGGHGLDYLWLNLAGAWAVFVQTPIIVRMISC